MTLNTLTISLIAIGVMALIIIYLNWRLKSVKTRLNTALSENENLQQILGNAQQRKEVEHEINSYDESAVNDGLQSYYRD